MQRRPHSAPFTAKLRAGLWAGAKLASGAILFCVSALPAAATDCGLDYVRVYQDDIHPVAQEDMIGTHRDDGMTPPENPDVGDSWIWYTWRLAGFPTADPKVCTVRGEGENVYIVVEDSQWLTNVDQADVDAMIEAWDNSSLGPWPDQGIYDLGVANFGPVPDELDQDPKVYVLYYDFDVSSDGFFWAFDEYPDGTQDFASNECEVLYMNSSVFDPGGDYLISVQAHEFQHMIHWLADDNEMAWVNEGCSELAMWFYGHPDQVVAFPSNPDNNLTSWGGAFADYVKTYLWMLYFYEHFGGQASILDLVSDPLNSIASFDQTLADQGYSERFDDVIADWYVANYLDDPAIGGGKYNYAGETLPPFAAITKSSYPVSPTNATVNHWATDYVRFINGVPQRLFFDGSDNSTWRAQVVRFLAGSALSVEDIPLDAVDAGFIDLPEFGDETDEVVLVAGNVSLSGLLSYQYHTEAEPAGAEDTSALVPGTRWETVGAHPFSGSAELVLHLDNETSVEITILDAAGRTLRTVHRGKMAAGPHRITWDGSTDAGGQAGNGVYFARAQSGLGAATTTRLVRVH